MRPEAYCRNADEGNRTRSCGRTEALNSKARTITRRAYGLHSAAALIALLKLCCSGMDLEPVTLRPGSTH